MERIELIINADDYGMCPAVTDGILLGFRHGVVTQASIMPPAPDALRAATLARACELPLGVHLTLACEWETLAWGSLTGGPTLERSGVLPPHVRELDAHAAPEEVKRELYAQVRWVRQQQIEPHHLDAHIAPFDPILTAQVSAVERLPSRDPVPMPGLTMALDSVWHLSLCPAGQKLEQLLAHVRRLKAGRHLIICHPALDWPELRELVAPTSRRWKWARDIRVSDLQALLDPRFLGLCRERAIQLTTT